MTQSQEAFAKAKASCFLKTAPPEPAEKADSVRPMYLDNLILFPPSFQFFNLFTGNVTLTWAFPQILQQKA